MAKKKGMPKARINPGDKEVRATIDPDSYLATKPVWRFADFDWDGPWGQQTCVECGANLRKHVEDHLSNFESMTWGEILKAAGAKAEGKGNNHHPISRDKFTKEAQARLQAKGIQAETLFSLRLDRCTRIYGVREHNCLRIVFLDTLHCDQQKSAYKFGN